ncbi:MAG: T9SS type A sorting domain-containing protein [Bacteroidia bacterium]
MKIQIILIVLSLILNVHASSGQHFEWAASADNLITGYKTSAITVDGRLIAAGQYTVPSYSISNADKGFYDGAGKFYALDNPYQDQLFVTCFNDRGTLDWLISGSSIASNSSLLGVTTKSDGNVVIAFKCGGLPELPATLFDEFNLISDSVLETANYNDYNNIYGRQGIYSFVFFAEVDKSGNVKDYHAVRMKNDDEWYSFKSAADGSMYITLADEGAVKQKDGKPIKRPFNYLIKIGSDYKVKWTSSMQYLSNSCCSFHANPIICDVSGNNDIFVAGNFHGGLVEAPQKTHMTSSHNPQVADEKAYESYVASISKDNGKLKWIKYSGGESLIYDISVSESQVIIGGKTALQKKIFNLNADTTNQKKAFLMAFSLQGNPKWIKTFNGEEVNAVTSDFNGGIYASFRSKRNKFVEPLKIGKDTISDTYERIVVAKFDENGEYEWYKRSAAMMSIRPNSKLHTDACGNLYFTGEMWYVLPASLSIFDAALVSGKGYGGAPIAARIRTTIPEQLLSINVELSQSFNVRLREKEKKTSKIVTSDTRKPSGNQDSSLVSIEGDQRGRKGNCIPIPYPWNIKIFPNPSQGAVTISVDLSYADNSVSMELWGAKGDFIKKIMSPTFKNSGVFTVEEDFSNYSAGFYLIVVKGSATALSEKFLIVK